ncbi:hypothetical protein V6N11_034691 [Hibiscus sabdariffa]|uniref:MSP domain-containing protein n=1 Tax=Hibiscus sabdariffa TaxID=183260 RepID=A0ABR2NE84_9ROSI
MESYDAPETKAPPALLNLAGSRQYFISSAAISLYLSRMSTGELLIIEPLELQFPFELRKQISCSLNLSNKTDNYVAFKVKTTNPKKYCVRPNTGAVLPRSTCNVIGLCPCPSCTKFGVGYSYFS